MLVSIWPHLRTHTNIRDVQKLSAVISYIGGLVGAVSALLFIIKIYTDISLEFSIASDLFQRSKDRTQREKDGSLKQNQPQFLKGEKDVNQENSYTFNLITFIKYSSYRLLMRFKFTETWEEAKMLDEFRKEIINHLDIKVLLNPIISIERSMSELFDTNQLSSLQERPKMRINEVRKLHSIFTGKKDEKQEQNQIDQELTQNQLFKVKQGQTINIKGLSRNTIQVGNQDLRQQLDHQSSLNNKKGIANRRNQINVGKATQNSDIGLGEERLIVMGSRVAPHFSNVQSQRQQGVTRKVVWQNIHNEPHILRDKTYFT